MGYRSRIYLKSSLELVEEFKDLFNQEDYFYDELKEDDTFFYVYWSDIKWYDSFKTVQDINRWVNHNSNTNAVGMIEIGEDNETTHYGNPYDVDLYEEVEIKGFK